MSSSGSHQHCDVLIVHGCDGEEWSTYLKSLLSSSRYFKNKSVSCYNIMEGSSIPIEQMDIFNGSKCIIFLLTGELVNNLHEPSLLKSLQEALGPPERMFVLFCGVSDSEEFTVLFHDWPLWKKLYCEDDPESYISAVKQTVSEDSGCESVTDTDDELQTPKNTRDHTVVIFPKKIRCGEPTKLYIILKCELDSQVKTEVEFSSKQQQPPLRIPATQENKYTVSVNAPNLSSGTAKLTVFSGELNVCSVLISYYTDMEEVSNLLKDVTNPMEFMCQAFKIIPYKMETLDKLLTESLKQNIPACGLHIFGISQLEEASSATQRDEELPTLLHFAAKYGLKNLTALLLTCPGALQAYSISNKHGDYPNTIAEKNGFKDLRQFIDEYVETADMLKSHIKEELMQGEEDESIYESMVNLSTDFLMKCSLNPGCQEDIYESMILQVPEHTTDDLYEDMMRKNTSLKQAPDLFAEAAEESILHKFLAGKTQTDPKEEPFYSSQDDLYDEIEKEEYSQQINRPPAPAPRPKPSSLREDSEPYISRVFQAKVQSRPENFYTRTLPPMGSQLVRDRPQSSVYDPFAGMKTPGQRQLITLQEQVKLEFITVEEAVQQFKEWQFNQKRRNDSFRFQQENLKKLRESIMRREKERRKAGKDTSLEITEPIRPPRQTPNRRKSEDYNTSTRMSAPPFTRWNWKTESTSSTASSASTRSSVRSMLSISSGAEGDNEDNEIMESSLSHNPRMSDRQPPPLPPQRPPRIPPRLPNRLSAPETLFGPPVPPRGR